MTIITNVTPELQVSDKGLVVAFFEKEIEKNGQKNIELMIRIDNPNDLYSTIIRKVKDVRFIDNTGEVHFIPEKKYYAKAFAKFQEVKANAKPSAEDELKKALAEIEKLKSQKVEEVADSVEDFSLEEKTKKKFK